MTELGVLSVAADLAATGRNSFHGYEMTRLLASTRHRVVAHTTVYRALLRLEGIRLLESRWEDATEAESASRPRRRLYSLTNAGATVLLQSGLGARRRLNSAPEASRS
jgi:PadR family transcriptional regulator, regulatory protein PadR